MYILFYGISKKSIVRDNGQNKKIMIEYQLGNNESFLVAELCKVHKGVDKERKRMEILKNIFSCFLAVFIMSIPTAWMWVLYYKIKCRKVDSCADRKCKYWNWCNHNYEERKKDEIELRKQNLMRKHGLMEDDLNEESRQRASSHFQCRK